MARLSSRPGFSDTDAAAFKKRANGPHTIKWRANSYRWTSGNVHEILYQNLPIVGGTLSLDSSDPIRRHLTLEVAGLGKLVPDKPNDALAPFGQYLKLWMTIDREGGGWFPELVMGEYPIQTVTSEWPSLIQTVECADHSAVVDQFLHTHKKGYNKLTIHNAVKQLTEAALPDRVFSIHSTDEAKSTKVEPHSIAEAGSGRWETAVSLCQARGFETFFNTDGDLVVRKDITNDDSETIPAVGPDIGTVTYPVAVIRDGNGGNLVALTQGVTREGGANGVFINLHETASQTLRRQGRPVSGDKRVNVQVSALADGPIKWGDRYGRQPIVIEKPVKVITDDVVAAQTRRAKRILNRRGGVIRTLDLDAVGLWWLEPDDRVKIQYDGRTEYHFVASIEFDLAGESPARIRTRALAVEDPG
jgi:hypothetical protein